MGFIFKPWKKLSLFTRIMIGFVLGIIAGLILGDWASNLSFLGDILTNLLTMVVGPLVLCLLVSAVADLGDGKKLGRIGIKAVLTFLIITMAAIVVGLVISNLMNIGSGITITLTEETEEAASSSMSLIDTLVNIFPSNIMASLNDQSLLQIIFFALVLGFALMKMGDKGKPVLKAFSYGKDALQEVINLVLEFTPYGVFGLMANVIGTNGPAIMLPYIKAILALYISAIIYMVVVQAGIMAGLIGKISPIRFLAAMKEAMIFAFTTCSSVATIPVNTKCVKSLGVDDETTNFVVPFGAVVNMNGTAIYEAVAVIFTAQVFGIDLTIMDQVMIMITATLSAVGTAGIPGSGLVMLTVVLTSAGLPMEAIGLLAGIDRILNMGRVVPNILGDAAAAVVVSKSEGLMENPPKAAEKS